MFTYSLEVVSSIASLDGWNCTKQGYYPYTCYTGTYKHICTRGPWALPLRLWCLATCPDNIQLRFMLNGHVAEVKYLVFKVQVYLYSAASLHDQNPKMTLNTKHAKRSISDKGTPYTCLQLLPTSKFHSAFLYSYWPKIHNAHTNDTCTLFYPRRLKLSLFLLLSCYWQQFLRYGLIYKMPHLGLKLGHWQKIQKFHICYITSSFSSPRGWN